MLQTPLGTLTLEVRTSLQPGSRILFELPAGAIPQVIPDGAGKPTTPLSTLAHSWPALEEALHALQQISGTGVAAPQTTDPIPQPGPKLASGLLFFLSALSGGEIKRWLGEPTMKALKSAGRDQLIARLGREFSQTSRLADSPAGDWRLLFIPLMDGEQLQQLRLFLRHGQEGHGQGTNDSEQESTRFLLEVELTSLGDLQLDGLVRDKQFDLIVRTRQPLSDVMRHDITRIFQDANDIAGYAGSIGFQASSVWNFIPIEDGGAASPGLVV